MWHVLYIGTKDGSLKKTYYTNPQPGGQICISSDLISKYEFLLKFISTKPTAAMICKEICEDMIIPIKSISPLACKNELENLSAAKTVIQKLLNDTTFSKSSKVPIKTLFYQYYSSKCINYTLVMHPVGRHYDVFADDCSSLENRVCFELQNVRTKLSVLPYGRGGCGLNKFCFAILDWETAHKRKRAVWYDNKHSNLIYSAYWYASQGNVDQKFTKTVRNNFFGAHPHLNIDSNDNL